jgi:hypothetical protein
MTPTEFDAGGGQTIAVYLSPDTGEQVDQDALFQEIAADSTERAGRGQRIVSVSMSPTRHSAVMFGREGSGYVSEMAITVVYAAAAPSA